jgi:hypothetical protein
MKLFYNSKKKYFILVNLVLIFSYSFLYSTANNSSSLPEYPRIDVSSKNNFQGNISLPYHDENFYKGLNYYSGVIISIAPLGNKANIRLMVINDALSSSAINVSWAYYNATTVTEEDLVLYSNIIDVGAQLNKSFILDNNYIPGEQPLAGFFLFELMNKTANSIVSYDGSATFLGFSQAAFDFEIEYSVLAMIFSIIIFKRKNRNKSL